MATRNPIAITEAAFVPKDPIAATPEKAAAKEITKVIIEIHRFIGVLTLVPWMLYAILAPRLSTLLVKAIRNAYRNFWACHPLFTPLAAWTAWSSIKPIRRSVVAATKIPTGTTTLASISDLRRPALRSPISPVIG